MGKTVLVIGSGGREHALAWKLAQSPEVEKVFIARGNAGTAEVGTNVPVGSEQVEELAQFALKVGVDLTVVGPDLSLSFGIVDEFQKWGLRIFGPKLVAAEIEANKAFAKRLMSKLGIPTPMFRVFYDRNQACTFLCNTALPLVVKANGPAQGKGVYVCHTLVEAFEAVDKILVKQLHGPAHDGLVVENFVHGPEVSLHAFCDGTTFRLFPPSRDHKTLLDLGKGPNTGGMGAFAPIPNFHPAQMLEGNFVVDKILRGLEQRGISFTGCLYPGLVLSPDGLQVLEFNARFGDPEAQVYMRLLKTDLFSILDACATGGLDKFDDIEWHPGYAVCVNLVSGGYPEPNCRVGFPITGIVEAEQVPSVKVFHAGTRMVDGVLQTAAGRVLSVTATGDDLETAVKRAYEAVERIHFKGMQYRTDIGRSGL